MERLLTPHTMIVISDIVKTVVVKLSMALTRFQNLYKADTWICFEYHAHNFPQTLIHECINNNEWIDFKGFYTW